MGLKSTFTATPADSDFSVEIVPSNPFVGEAFYVELTGDGSHSGFTDQTSDIWIEADIGESGAQFTSIPSGTARPFNAEKAYGRNWTHAYHDGAGNKTVSLTSWTYGSGSLSQQFTVPVQDPDAYSWDHTYWIDTSGDATGMPANDANNTRILSSAAFLALDNTFGSTDDIRLRFRSGETMAFAWTNYIRTDGNITMFDVFGGTAKCTLQDTSTGTVTANRFFSTGTNGQRLIFNSVECVGQFQVVDGVCLGPNRNYLSTFGQTDLQVSMSRCGGRGLQNLVSNNGDGSQDIFLHDCDYTDYLDYAIFADDVDRFALRGNNFLQNPRTLNELGKPAPTSVDAADHANFRVVTFRRVSVTQNLGGTYHGWTSLGSSTLPPAHQAFGRLYWEAAAQPANAFASLMMNETYNGDFLWGARQNDTTSVIEPAEIYVAGNMHHCSLLRTAFIRTMAGGFKCDSNILYAPDIRVDASSAAFFVLQDGELSSGVSDAAWEEPNTLRHNTIVSDRTNETGDLRVSSVNRTTNMFVPTDGTVDGAVVTESGNVVCADSGYSNAGTLPGTSAVARGDRFRNITGGATDNTTTSGPPADVLGVQRTGSTQDGAHHASGSDVSFAAPANLTAPVIREAISPRSNEAVIDSLAGGDNLGFGFFREDRWSADSVEQTPIQPNYAFTPGEDVTLNQVWTNQSGQRVSAPVSNTLST